MVVEVTYQNLMTKIEVMGFKKCPGIRKVIWMLFCKLIQD